MKTYKYFHTRALEDFLPPHKNKSEEKFEMQVGIRR
jgi:hypothetical protein